MNKLNTIKFSLLALVLCMSVSLFGCGNKEKQNGNDEISSSQTQEKNNNSEVTVDYGDAESFEAALNDGSNLEGKVVQFVVNEFHPDSELGYNLWAGKHLNFVSARHPDADAGETVTVRATTIEKLLGSWIINYEKVDNAVVNEDTITSSKMTTTAKAAATTVKAQTTEKATTSVKKEETTKAETSKPTEAATEKAENTYTHNEYYDVVETSSFTNSIGYTIVVHKVLAKKNVSISSTLLAYEDNGNIIGKSSDSIVLTEGKYNYFRYSFDGDISNANLDANASAKKDSIMTGERNAVEMVQYNQSGDNLYITLQQTGDEVSSFAQFKILYYSDDKIVDTDEGYFSIYAKNLNGKGSTDVAELWVWGKSFDRVEFIYEP